MRGPVAVRFCAKVREPGSPAALPLRVYFHVAFEGAQAAGDVPGLRGGTDLSPSAR